MDREVGRTSATDEEKDEASVWLLVASRVFLGCTDDVSRIGDEMSTYKLLVLCKSEVFVFNQESRLLEHFCHFNEGNWLVEACSHSWGNKMGTNSPHL